MKTKIRTYERNGKKIVIVGVAHVGTKDYYSKIQNTLDGFDPKCVLYEGVTGADDSGGIMKMYTTFAKLLDVEMQKAMVKYSEKWVHCDLDHDLLEVANGGPYLPDVSHLFEDGAFSVVPENKRSIKLAIKFLLDIMRLILFFKKSDPVIVDLRNSYVILKAFEILKSNEDVCIFYGEAHYKGIEKFIKSVGFKLVSKETMNPFK